MGKYPKVTAYARDRDANKDAPYATKFANFMQTVAQAKATGCSGVLIAEPWVIGDTYEEMIQSLSYLAGTSLGLQIATAQKSPWNK